MDHPSSQRGFTLVELLVVVMIIGILTTIVTVGLQSAKNKSRDAKRIADIKTIQLALATYYNDNGFYPRHIYAASNANPGVSDPANGLAPAYLSVVPKDPSATASTDCNTTGINTNTGCYHYNSYITVSSGICNTTSIPILYHLGAALEESTNIALTQDVAPSSLSMGGSATQATFNSVTYYRCSNANSPSAQFEVDAAACSGLTNTTDTCYSLTP
jgi:type II secretion system protein G